MSEIKINRAKQRLRELSDDERNVALSEFELGETSELIPRVELDWQRDLNTTLFRCILQYALSTERILSTLDFCYTPNWLEIIKKRQRDIEDAYHRIEDEIHRFYDRQRMNLARKGVIITKREFQLTVLQYVTPTLSDLQEAIAEANNGDSGAELLRFAARWQGAERFTEIFEKTTTIAVESKMQRHTIYIGRRLHDIEKVSGTNNIRQAWRQIHRDLAVKARQDINLLDDDERAAWQYFTEVQPLQKKGYDLVQFEQQLRTMKTRTKSLD